ncbi:YbhB/YbcL family Raf kinase inhibitor-like protein [Aspergillus fischeri NRRL 181]|uniref:Phosphatidylethanolamine-binding protein n=1 Tax=Neosartorya fischeri (strain ATCC 1020 / DSM 3700 / CBS 544.65 / FGSC A1164 / JCM 1740 / NRRL 181 / WB 181) TaxID=331117 RepID=A1DK84_NEOFI|nr:phosphatidylethanolamine-binding protein [Aspergillus fischeri NRRL 181]EAW17123.1 phosphatidylethanolamine-binding protein [Aspergillus fischeri NRRL 181]
MSLESHTQQLTQSLAQANLTPGLLPFLPPDFKPTTQLHVSFNNKPVSLGNLFRASECKTAPSVSFSKEENNQPSSTSYTLLLVDPDAPTPDDPKFAFWRHWVVSGLKAEEGDSGTAVTEYLGPGPKDEEPEGFALTKEDVGGEEFTARRSFKVAEWVERHGLELVGVNWMLGAGDGWTE